MKVFVTGVAGQLGHDVMNELNKRGYEGIGSDIAPEYSGVEDGSAVTTMPYVSLDITDKEAVEKVLTEQKPDVVVHCAAWTAVDLAEDDDKVEKVRAINAGGTENIAKVCKKLDSNLLCDRADDVHHGRLPYHVRILADEFANIGQIPKFDKLIATIRSREISASIILQSQSQLKTIYKDAAETILGNCVRPEVASAI